MTALDTLGRQKTVLLETRKRDGTWVGTPVSIVVDGGRAYLPQLRCVRQGQAAAQLPRGRVAPSTLRGQADRAQRDRRPRGCWMMTRPHGPGVCSRSKYPLAARPDGPGRAQAQGLDDVALRTGAQLSTKDVIVGRAMELFGRQGYHATTIAQIEAAAGLSAGSGGLYRHFKSKRQVLEEALRRQAEQGRPLLAYLEDPSAFEGMPRRERFLAVARAGPAPAGRGARHQPAAAARPGRPFRICWSWCGRRS